MEDFKSIWDRKRLQNCKLVLYNSIKSSFEPEKYIDAHLGYKDLRSQKNRPFPNELSQVSNRKGRYGSQYGNVLNRICEYRITDDRETLELLKECPFFDPIIEDEFQVLNFCPRYQDARVRRRYAAVDVITWWFIPNILAKCANQRPCTVHYKMPHYKVSWICIKGCKAYCQIIDQWLS